MRIQSSEDFGLDRLKLLVFGPPGAGKTTLLGTVTEPMVIVSAEAGLLVLKDKKIDVIDITTDDKGNLIPKEKRIARLAEAYKYLNTEEAKAKYKWVGVDSLTEIAQNLVEGLSAEYPERKDGLVLWGEYSKQIRGIIKSFRDIPYYNVLFTALSEKEKDENGMFNTGVMIQGKISQSIAGFFDEVFFLQTMKDAEGKTQRRLLTSSTDTILAKDRSGMLNQYEEPNMALITNKIRGVKNV